MKIYSSRLLFVLLAVFLASHPQAALAAPRPVTVTPGNISLFKQIAPPAPYFCFTPSSQSGRLGTLTRNRLRVGSRWTQLSLASLQRSISIATRDLRRLELRGRTNSRSYRLKKAALENMNAKLRYLQNLIQLCDHPTPPPTPTPSPTPSATPSPTPSLPPRPPEGEFSGDANSLSPYHEQLTEAEINHILEKVAFGGTEELKTIGRTQGLSALVNALVDGVSPEDNLEEQAQFWTDRAMYRPEDRPGIIQWTMEAAQWGEFVRLLYTRNPFHEFMTVVFNGHFATNLNAIGVTYSDARGHAIPEHIERLRRQSLGNFLALAQEMVTDTAMSEWLNNDDNHADAPNQNFAREFLELFTLGAIDPITGAKNYDERTIVASTTFFSGFEGIWGTDAQTGLDTFDVVYNQDLHDNSIRTAFPGIADAQITANLDWMQFPRHVLMNHPNANRYVAERLMAELVFPDVPESLVSEGGQFLKGSSYELKPFYKKLLQSQAMFSQKARKPCVMAPVEMNTRLYRRLQQAALPRDGEEGQHSEWLLWGFLENSRAMGQLIFEPPSVFGWKGACGINRAGSKAYGEGFVNAQRVLNRDRACINLVDFLTWNAGTYSFTSLFPSKNIAAAEAVDHLAFKLFDSAVTSAQRGILVDFLTHEKDDQNQLIAIDFDLNDEWYVQRKIPRLVCLLQGLLDNNLR